MVALCGARLVPGTLDLHGELPEPPLVGLRRERLEHLIGMEYSEATVERVLTRLGYTAEDGRWRVPTWRAGDTTREVDLIEEVARIDGVWKVPTVMPPHADAIGRVSEDVRLRRRVIDVLLGCGLSESATLAFTDEGLADRLRFGADDTRREQLRVANPMGADQALLRSQLFPGLLDSVRRNLDAGQTRIALFETGRVFLPGGGELPEQPVRVAGVLAGADADFVHMKGVTEALAAALRAPLGVAAASEPFLHPGRSAKLGRAGVLGEVHPLVAEAWGIEATVSLFEIDLEELRADDVPVYRDVLTYPPVRQDIAVVVDAETPAGEVLAHVRDSAGDLLATCRVFDVYEGPQVGDGRKSLAIHLVFQAPDRTLTDEEADAAREQIVGALGERFGATLRS